MELHELAELGSRLVDEVERAVVGKREQLELILLNLAKLENTEAIRQQLVAVYNQLEELHDQRRQQRGSDRAPALL